MDNKETPFQQIVRSLTEKAPLKVIVNDRVIEAHNLFKSVLLKIEDELLESMSNVEKRVDIKFRERGRFDLEMKISDDIIIYSMHTDSLIFPESHRIWKSSYIEEDRGRAFCGMISIYNFLTDSIKYNRMNDQGVLIARVFVNHENHFFVEGKKQLGFLFNDFGTALLTEKNIRKIVEASIIVCLDTDIVVPPFEDVKIISVQEIMEKSLSSVLSTGKRLGFRLQSDADTIT